MVLKRPRDLASSPGFTTYQVILGEPLITLNLSFLIYKIVTVRLCPTQLTVLMRGCRGNVHEHSLHNMKLFVSAQERK